MYVLTHVEPGSDWEQVCGGMSTEGWQSNIVSWYVISLYYTRNHNKPARNTILNSFMKTDVDIRKQVSR